MSTISLRTDPDLELALARIQSGHGLGTRSEAIRVAIVETDRRLARRAMHAAEIEIFLAAGPDPEGIDSVESARATNAAWAGLDETDWDAVCAQST
ncbi:MAG: hypothetical protein ACT4PP_00750 [Sporichthyaceae bacterium]